MPLLGPSIDFFQDLNLNQVSDLLSKAILQLFLFFARLEVPET